MNGTPLLQYAFMSGSADLVERIITMEADIHFANSPRGTALTVAAEFGSLRIVLLLLGRGVDINVVGGDYGTALGCAALGGDVEVVSLLLKRGADINVVGSDYGTPLGCLCASSNDYATSDLVTSEAVIATLLLQRGTDVNIPFGSQYGTVLDASASIGRIELVRAPPSIWQVFQRVAVISASLLTYYVFIYFVFVFSFFVILAYMQVLK